MKVQTSEFVEDKDTCHTTQQSDNLNCSFLVIMCFNNVTYRVVASHDSQNPLSIGSEFHPCHNSLHLSIIRL